MERVCSADSGILISYQLPLIVALPLFDDSHCRPGIARSISSSFRSGASAILMTAPELSSLGSIGNRAGLKNRYEYAIEVRDA